MSQNYKKINPLWKPGRDKPINVLYCASDRGRQVKNASRIIQKALELNLTAAESNALFDASGRFKTERHQAFVGHRQVILTYYFYICNYKLCPF